MDVVIAAAAAVTSSADVIAVFRCLRMTSTSTVARPPVTFLPSTWSQTRSSWSARRRTDSARASPVLSFFRLESWSSEPATERSVSSAAWKAASSEPSK